MVGFYLGIDAAGLGLNGFNVDCYCDLQSWCILDSFCSPGSIIDSRQYVSRQPTVTITITIIDPGHGIRGLC